MEINIFGETQREQWHSVVNLLRIVGENRKSRDELCAEIDRYIDFVEDILDEMRKEENS